MRFKFYLRGCGLGILLATLILMVGMGHEQKNRWKDEDVIAKAKELGMVFPEEDAVDNSKDDSQSASEPDSEMSPDTKAETPDTDQEEAAGKPTEAQEPSENNDQPVRITVRPGEVCREIAEELYANGIVSDADEFRLFMKDCGYDNSILAGEYEFTRGMEYLEIAGILTAKQ